MLHTVTYKGPSRILMPTDFQQSARRAFLHAVKLATAFRARLTILHVIKAPADSQGAVPDSRYMRSLKTAAMLNLGRLTQSAKESGAHAEPLLLYGVPSACIQEGAKRIHADMIVMGTEGRLGWDRLRVGSTAEATVRESRCPVLTVHGGLAGDVPRHPAKVHVRRMLAATDFSRRADAALETLCGLAVRLRTSVCVVHASAASSSAHAERMVAKRVLELQHHQVDAEGVCAAGDPVEVILAQAAAWQADLIAVGTQGRRGLSRVVLGSVAEAVLRRAGCPVLTVGQAQRHTAMIAQKPKGS